ncbi:uncharacterized protein C8Q71DRAFT_850976 [Rhodofomes roseus]|uniref:Uncharacterized protein n=1 Tax=Rhodofomes roseus TaxID=34475 RepID=A0A4Y9YY99_9APHY|nr:uncharacterized protein C8Q71DRAFT_850976 [Rhodofomes roseus]KAH9830907.1 hypothetical protein C8Q71DRAFT_850976 [Rhodofomes roseus]TFY67354.1 hypothetical protein EVJ58_g1686 [Rhodofomes roseus]
MRTTVAVAVILAAASAAPSFAAPITSAEFVTRDTNGELEARGKGGKLFGGVVKGRPHFLREDSPELYARSFEDEGLYARDTNGELEARSKKGLKTAGKVLGGVAKGLLHFLREDDPELYARSFEDESLYTRDISGELEARSKKGLRTAGKVVGGIAKGLLHFLREDPVLVRAFEEEPELFMRGFESDELMAREFDDEMLMAREFDDDMLFARDMEIDELD